MKNHRLSVHSSTSGTPPADAIRFQLERIATSPHLQASEKRIAFLKFIVEESLADRADTLKGYTVAVAVFGRDETFDPQSDPVVRLEARRLRRDLDSYYVSAGNRDPVRITIPKGSYAPRFEWLNPPQLSAEADKHQLPDSQGSLAEADNVRIFKSDSASTRWRKSAGFLVLLMLVILGWKFLIDQPVPETVPTAYPAEPSVMVLPFEALGNTEYSQYLAIGVSHELIGNLMRFPGLRLYTLPGTGSSAQTPSGINNWLSGHPQEMEYIVRGSVHENSSNVYLAAELLLSHSGEVLWSANYDRPFTPTALAEVQAELAGTIASEIAQPYGVISDNLNQRLSTGTVKDMQSYVCVLRAFSYRRNFSQQEHGPVLACLQQAILRDPEYSDAWAMLGWLYLDAGRYEYSDPDQMTEEYQKALHAASQAVSLEPNSTLALKALSSVNHYLGDFAESERLARKALALNPYDPDTLAQLGWRLAVRGNFSEGIAFLEQAISRTARPPSWYFDLIAIDDYLSGDIVKMLADAQQSAVGGSVFGQALIAIASTKLRRREDTIAALLQLQQFKPMLRDPAEYMRRNGATDEIVDALMAGLEEAREYADM